MKEFYSQYRTTTTSYLAPTDSDPLGIIRNKYKRCDSCEKFFEVYGHGALNPALMFISDSVSQYDIQVGSIFADSVGKKVYGLVEYINRVKPTANNTYFTCLKLCPDEKTSAAMKRLREEVSIVSPRKIILLGEKIFSILFPADDFESARKRRLHWKMKKTYNCYVTYSLPDLFYRRDEVKLNVKEDLDFIISDE